MTVYARIVDGCVAEPLITIPDDMEIGAFFNTALVEMVQVSTQGVREGWLYDGEAFSAPPAPPPQAITKPVPSATGAQLRDALTDAQATAIEAYLVKTTPATRDYWVSGYRDVIPKTSPKLARIAKGAGLDIETWFAAAATE